MAKGGTTPVTQTTTAQPSWQQQQLMNLALPGVQKFAASVPERYQGSTISPFDPLQTAGQNMATAGAGSQADVADAATQALLKQLGGSDRTAVTGPAPVAAPTVAGPASVTAPTVAGPNISSAPFGESFWEPQNNQILRGAIEATTRPITQAYQENVLPSIRNDTIAQGGATSFGGSRQGVAEGIASRGYENAIGDAAAKLAQSTYGTNVGALADQYKTQLGGELQKYGTDVNAGTARYGADVNAATQRYGTDVGAGTQRYGTDVGAGTQRYATDVNAATSADRLNADTTARALGLVPTVQSAEVQPGATLSAVGDVRQQMEQALLNQKVAGFNWDQFAPFLQSKDILGLTAGMPGGSTTATASNPQVNPFMSALGGAASGAAMGTAIMPGWGTAIGAGVGGLGSLLFNR